MPPLPSVPGVVRVSLKFTADASIDLGTHFYLSYTGGTPTASDCETIAGGAQGGFGGSWMPEAGSNLTLVQVACQDLSSSSGAIGFNNTTQNGGGAQTILTASAAAVVNHQIGRRYRGGKPRNYMPGVQPSQLNGSNELSTAAQAAFLSAWEAAIAHTLDIGGGGVTLQNIVNVSYFEGFTAVLNPVTGRTRDVPKLRLGGPQVDVINSSTVAIKLGSQRRRLNT